MHKNFNQKGFTNNFLSFMKELERNKLCCLDFLTKIYTEDTTSVILTGDGTKANPLEANVLLSQNSGNILTLDIHGGLFVPNTGGGGGLLGAANGLSTLGGVYAVLGNDVGDATNPAKFLSDREIQSSGHYLYLVGASGQAGPKTQLSDGIVIITDPSNNIGSLLTTTTTVLNAPIGTNSGETLQVYGVIKVDTLPTTTNPTTPVAWDNTTHQLVVGAGGGAATAINGTSIDGSGNVILGQPTDAISGVGALTQSTFIPLNNHALTIVGGNVTDNLNFQQTNVTGEVGILILDHSSNEFNIFAASTVMTDGAGNNWTSLAENSTWTDPLGTSLTVLGSNSMNMTNPNTNSLAQSSNSLIYSDTTTGQQTTTLTKALLTIVDGTVSGTANFSATAQLLTISNATANIRSSLSYKNAAINLPTATAISAQLHIGAGSATAGTAPIKLISGPLLTTPEVGTIEYLTDKAYLGITTGAARKEFTLNDGVLTSGRIPFATTNGRLLDDAGFKYSSPLASGQGPNFVIGPYTLTNATTRTSLSFIQTWNTTAGPTVIGMNITDTASDNSVSYLINATVNSTTVFAVDKFGTLTAGDPASGSGAWRLGTTQTGVALTLKTTQYVEVSINGTVVKLAVVN